MSNRHILFKEHVDGVVLFDFLGIGHRQIEARPLQQGRAVAQIGEGGNAGR